jgi:hypothetical protein
MPTKLATEKPVKTRSRNKKKTNGVPDNNDNSFRSNEDPEDLNEFSSLLDNTITHDNQGNIVTSPPLQSRPNVHAQSDSSTLKNSSKADIPAGTPHNRSAIVQLPATPWTLPPIPQPILPTTTTTSSTTVTSTPAAATANPEPKDPHEANPTKPASLLVNVLPAFSEHKGPITLETLYDTLITFTLALKSSQAAQDTKIECIETKLQTVLKKSDDLTSSIAVNYCYQVHIS